MDEILLFAGLAILVLLVIGIIIRYKQFAEAEFSIFDFIKFKFKGRNRQEEGSLYKSGVEIKSDSDVTTADVVGRDKVTNIFLDSQRADDSPNLSKFLLKLFKGDDGEPLDEIEFETHRSLPQAHSFGFELENENKDTFAKGFYIGIVVSWRGNLLEKCPYIRIPSNLKRIGWTERRGQVGKDGQPAILWFNNQQLTYPGPRAWRNFKLILSEHLNGYLQIHYEISTDEPRSRNEGKIKISLVNKR